jgi:hypothetical protein
MNDPLLIVPVDVLSTVGSVVGILAAVLWVLVAHRATVTGIRIKKSDKWLIVGLLAFGMTLSGRAVGRILEAYDYELGRSFKELFFAVSSILMFFVAARLLFSASCDGGETCCQVRP